MGRAPQSNVAGATSAPPTLGWSPAELELSWKASKVAIRPDFLSDESDMEAIGDKALSIEWPRASGTPIPLNLGDDEPLEDLQHVALEALGRKATPGELDVLNGIVARHRAGVKERLPKILPLLEEALESYWESEGYDRIHVLSGTTHRGAVDPLDNMFGAYWMSTSGSDGTWKLLIDFHSGFYPDLDAAIVALYESTDADFKADVGAYLASRR